MGTKTETFTVAAENNARLTVQAANRAQRASGERQEFRRAAEQAALAGRYAQLATEDAIAARDARNNTEGDDIAYDTAVRAAAHAWLAVAGAAAALARGISPTVETDEEEASYALFAAGEPTE